MTTYTVQFDAAGNELDLDHNDSNAAAPDTFAAMTYSDTSNRKASLNPAADPERALAQAHINDLAERTQRADQLALASDVFNRETGKPHPGLESLFARRMAVAQQLKDEAHYQMDQGNADLKARNFEPAPDPAIGDLRAQLEAQETAREAARLAKIVRRA